jgi:hypothetical protein
VIKNGESVGDEESREKIEIERRQKMLPKEKNMRYSLKKINPLRCEKVSC